MKKLVLSLLLVFIPVSAVYAGLVAREVDYSADGTTLKGYLAYDDSFKGKRPAILVVHEWWGHNEYARKRARMLAELGYIALAVDMYGEGRQASHPEEAGKFAAEVQKNLDVAKKRVTAAIDLLKKQKVTDKDHFAAIGYCFGGGVVLQMAREGMDLDGVVSFHGSLGTDHPAQAGKVKAKMLVATGAADPFVPADTVAAFKQEMDNAKVDYKLISYDGAKHSFTNPDSTAYGEKFNLPLQYNQQADEQSWAEMQAFFKKIFN